MRARLPRRDARGDVVSVVSSRRVWYSARYNRTINYHSVFSLVDRESCAKSFDGFSKLPRGLDESMLCVLDINDTRRSDACQGDSGGPLLMLAGPNHSIVGITAFGQSCGSPIPGVYTAIYSYLEWIERQVWPGITDGSQ